MNSVSAANAEPRYICECCLKANDATRHINPIVFDTGQCFYCRTFGEVCDTDLIDIYQQLGLSLSAIWKHLPRLRGGLTLAECANMATNLSQRLTSPHSSASSPPTPP